MKKLAAILLCLLLLTACGGAKPNDYIPMIMVDGEHYLDSGRGPVPGEVAPEAILGQITSAVEQSQKPTQDGQSNFGCVGSDYARVKEGIAVSIDNEWHIFVKEQ